MTCCKEQIQKQQVLWQGSCNHSTGIFMYFLSSSLLPTRSSISKLSFEIFEMRRKDDPPFLNSTLHWTWSVSVQHKFFCLFSVSLFEISFLSLSLLFKVPRCVSEKINRQKSLVKKEIQSLMSEESSCQIIKCIKKLCQIA